jgi:DNA binding protein with HTH domain
MLQTLVSLLSTAYTFGYYDLPRKIRLAQLAEKLNLSRSTLDMHLRRAERRSLYHIIDESRRLLFPTLPSLLFSPMGAMKDIKAYCQKKREYIIAYKNRWPKKDVRFSLYGIFSRSYQQCVDKLL